MANFEETAGYCKKCGKNLLIRRKGTNHLFHLLLSVITCGLWILVWIPSSVKFGGWYCSNCGTRKVKRV